ncbi:MAG: hypothetical protein Kow0075_11810 [Salibacteraceae bacterium]
MQIEVFDPKFKPSALQLMRSLIPAAFHPSEEALYEKYLESGYHNYFIGMLNEQLIAAFGIQYEDSNAVLTWDMIDTEHQGKGYGRMSVEFRLGLIEASPSIEKCIVRSWQGAYKFYEKCGFELTKQKRDHWAPGYHLYELSLQIR